MKKILFSLPLLWCLSSQGQSLTNQRLSSSGANYVSANSQIKFTLGSVSQTSNLFTVGLETINHDSKISLYPNPALDVVNLNNQTVNEYQLEIINPLGEIIKKSYINGLQSKAISMAHLANGLYFVNIYQDDKKIQSIKLLKQ